MRRRRKATPNKNSGKPCVDCEPGSRRPAPYSGPRCATHHREKTKANKDRSRDSYYRKTYNITEEQYNEILAHQGGVCFICGPITGRNGSSKRLAVDHDHSCCPGKTSCGKCVRGLLCSDCNRNVLGHLRDSEEALLRAIRYLNTHPAQEVLREGD